MAFRIHEHIVKGELSNRKRGLVTGRIWLAGCAKPLILHLSGNCHRDLAGCALVFKNPAPIQLPGDIKLNNIQRGVVGDITASRKVRVYDVPIEEALRLAKLGLPVPEHKANSLYLEWYSRTNGRVVIEGVDYEITISGPAWTLSPDDERRQFEENAQALQGFCEQITEGITAIHLDPDEDDAPSMNFSSRNSSRNPTPSPTNLPPSWKSISTTPISTKSSTARWAGIRRIAPPSATSSRRPCAIPPHWNPTRSPRARIGCAAKRATYIIR
ncbi:MAG TPA: hypothetical protein VG733_11395 [Chthoniobacteraceae bacterium]|nr:hypothetical protein [Chthoniobacteraceae bacterium]